jgi:hypothetical protein
MAVWQGERLIACVEVVAAETVQKNEFLSFISAMRDYLSGRIMLATLAFAAIASLAAILISRARPRRRSSYGRRKYYG